jgi:hypothetical protein
VSGERIAGSIGVPRSFVVQRGLLSGRRRVTIVRVEPTPITPFTRVVLTLDLVFSLVAGVVLY